VYSRNLETVSSARTRIERDVDPDAVRRLKETAKADITIGVQTSKSRGHFHHADAAVCPDCRRRFQTHTGVSQDPDGFIAVLTPAPQRNTAVSVGGSTVTVDALVEVGRMPIVAHAATSNRIARMAADRMPAQAVRERPVRLGLIDRPRDIPRDISRSASFVRRARRPDAAAAAGMDEWEQRLGTGARPVPNHECNDRNLRVSSSPRRTSKSPSTARFRRPDPPAPHSLHPRGRRFETRRAHFVMTIADRSRLSGSTSPMRCWLPST
jgi:hypothetical protein